MWIGRQTDYGCFPAKRKRTKYKINTLEFNKCEMKGGEAHAGSYFCCQNTFENNLAAHNKGSLGGDLMKMGGI